MAYSIIIKNDLSLFDREGFIHTRLQINDSEAGVYKIFSFGPANGLDGTLSFIGSNYKGIVSNEEDSPSLLNRPFNQSKEIAITEEKYNNLLNNIIPAFKDSQPNYDLMPDGAGTTTVPLPLMPYCRVLILLCLDQSSHHLS